MSEPQDQGPRHLTRRSVVGLGVAALAAASMPLGAAAYGAESDVTRKQLSATKQGVYRWAAPKGPNYLPAYASWIGIPTVWATDFLPADTWDSIAGPSWILTPWSQWVQGLSGRKLVLSVPMLVGPWDLSGPTSGSGAGQAVSLAAGAAGNYNSYFQKLAQNLVAKNLASTWIRVGWEFNGGWYNWRASSDPASWASYYQQIVTTMRAVSGAQFKFIWNPALGYQQLPAENVYPGDSHVDYVGLDVYDDSWAADTYPFPAGATATEIAARRKAAWDNAIYGGNHGISFWLSFASQHGKSLVFPEWGVSHRSDGHGGLDNPEFIQNMYNVMSAHSTPYACYFDVNATDGAHQLSNGNDAQGNRVTTEFPNSAAKFLSLFGG